jgi:isovaleryl-CoA dehydrogenase
MNQSNFRDYDLFNPTPEHEHLRQTVRQFAKREIDPGALIRDRDEIFDVALFRKMGELGLLGVTAPEEFGGSGMDALAAVIIHEELCAYDPGLGLAYLAHSMLCVNNIAVNANQEQKEKFLPKLCSGEWVGCMAMSEPEVGTDVFGLKTTAHKEKGVYTINGRKMWITNGVLDEKDTPADVVFLYAKTREGQSASAVSSFLVTPQCQGYSVGQKIHGKTGMRASSTAELVFDNCQVPEAYRVGEEGESGKHMMRNLEIERLTLAAMGLGIARRAIEIMVRYASERKAFGNSLSSFGQIQKMIAESYAEFRACRSYVYDVARRMKLTSAGNRKDSDGVKLMCGPMAKRVTDAAMQVLGGYGYVSEYVVERLWRDAKLLEIGGGTLEAHQKNISNDLCRNLGVEL